MYEEIFSNGSFRALLALLVTAFVMLSYIIALLKNNEKVTDKLTQSLVTIIALVMTFYFASEYAR